METALFGFLLGTVLGSFVKALADRSLSYRSFWGRSYCLQCKKTLQWYDLFPVVSYLILRGRCRYCHKKISLEYPIVEVILGILIGFLFWQSPFNFSAIGGSTYGWQFSIFAFGFLLKIFFIVILASLFLTDLKKMFIPDRIIIPSIILGIIANIAFTIVKVGYLYFTLNQTVLGKYLLPPYSDYFRRHTVLIIEPFLYSVVTAMLIAGFFMGLIIITKGKGMGGGDVKLGAFMGLMLGFPQALLALVLSFLTGAIFSIILIIFGKKRFGQTIAFGPFLVLGSLIALFWGGQIMQWYLKIGT